MRFTVILFLAVVSIGLACNRPAADTKAAKKRSESVVPTSPPSPRSVTLRSHLGGDIDDDPQLKLGETIRLVSADNERVGNDPPLLVQLPSETPYSGVDEQLFLRGYAIGKLANTDFQIM